MGYVRLDRKRVVIVDDSRTMQALLEHVLTTLLNCEVVGVAGDGASALTMVRRLRPDVVTIDLMMPYIDGRQLLSELSAFPDMRKVVISATACDNLSIRTSLEKLGADGCICKNEMSRDTDAFCRVLTALMRGPRRAKPVSSPVHIARTASPITPLIPFPVPVDEQERLTALAALDLANDEADYRLDLLTEHLARTTAFSASVMTFIDRETQWIKSAFGLERVSMARAEAICNYTICGDEPFIVSDTRADQRFASLEAVVSDPMIRSYAGYPIIGTSGVHLGAICLLDTKPRRVSVPDLTNLRSIARIAAHTIQTRAVPMRQAA